MEQTPKPTRKVLVAFDFDHTLIDDNSDLYVRKLAPNGKLPGHIKALYSSRGWTEYMGAIFQYLHENGTTREDMMACMHELPFVAGIVELLEHLSSDKFSVIIISDSNSVFIDFVMRAAGLDRFVDHVYTNPAEFNEKGCLTLRYYHIQDWCKLSTINLCKGHILEEHIKDAAAEGVNFPVVAYVGDGHNDLCPSLRLRSCDYVFARKKFTLIKEIDKLEEGQLKAKVVAWDTGMDLLTVLKGIEV